jgi:pSer/pThr/pTyr-binding forkhead associated (FHA) protein
MPDSRPTQLAPVDEGERTMIRTVRGRVTVADARQGWAHYLTYTDEAGVAQRVRLTDAPLRIGRRAPCELVIKDGEISGVHCELQARGDELFVSDRGSTNGTFVDGKRIFAAALVPHGGVLQVGRQVLKHEFRDERELVQSQELDRDLAKAAAYVRSLLPAPLAAGPLHTAWFYEPSTRVGGDAFGYHALDERRVVLYLLDVSGHGVGAAMHGVSVMNTLRQRTLPGVDFGDPAQVLEQLNAVFPMDGHGGMFFTIWYGVLDLATRELRYSSAGQHPAYALGGPGSVPRPLAARNLVIGACLACPSRPPAPRSPPTNACTCSATVSTRSSRPRAGSGRSRTFSRCWATRRCATSPSTCSGWCGALRGPGRWTMIFQSW